jgi:DNA modification methylase
MQDPVLSKLAVVYQDVDNLTAHPRNARTHTNHQVRQIRASIEAFGFTNPILVDARNVIIAGHGRARAAKLLGINEVPTIRIDTLTEDQIRAYMIADNQIAEKAGWDPATLAIELQHLLTIDGDLDVTVTGFEVPEVDLILQQAGTQSADKDDAVRIDQSGASVTQPGDLWLLGKHKILCGDSLELSTYKTLFESRKAQVAFLDPPYNLRIDKNVSGHGYIRRREFAMASGEMTEIEFIAFLTTSLRFASRFSSSGAIHFICMDWRHIGEVLAAGKQTYDSLLNVCVWVKGRGGLGSFYKSSHELIFVFRNGQGKHRNNVQLGRFGRDRTNVWQYDAINAFSSRDDEGKILDIHPTLKPVALVADALLDCSARGEIVLDAFLGSGTTLIAAQRVGRICYGIELDPQYVDVAIRRWQRQTGDAAIHAATDKRFDDVGASAEVPHD